MADSSKHSGTVEPGLTAEGNPDAFMARRVTKLVDQALEAKGLVTGDGGGGGHIGDMDFAKRIADVEKNVAGVRGALDMGKVVAATILAAMLAGFSLVTVLTLGNGAKTEASTAKLDSKIESLASKIGDEFRSQRQDQSAQITAISNAIIASRQQPPQVLLVPAPSPLPVTPDSKPR